MRFKNYLDACQQLSAWCQDEADACDDPREKALWLEGAAHWRECALIAEREKLAREAPSGCC